MTATHRLGAALAVLILLAPIPLRAEAATAVGVVETLHEALLDTMKQAKSLGYGGRFERVADILPQAFDLDFMARKSVGRHWNRLDEGEQQRWVESFVKLIAANYAGRFSAYAGERFETLGQEPASHETVVVRTKIVSPSAGDVELAYRLRENESGWRIVDVYLNGTVSELALRRSEFASVLKREGFAELVATVDRMTTELAEGSKPAKPARSEPQASEVQ